jgi:chromosome segregation ATPase
MSEELESDLLDERKFEQWMKKQKFSETLEKAMRFAEDIKEQFAEKIPVLSGNIESVTSEVKDVKTKLSAVDDGLSAVDKSIGVFGTGIDGVKEDINKFQVSQDSLEKLVQEKITVLSGNIENVTSEVKDVEAKLDMVDERLRLSTLDDRLNSVDRSIGVLRTGIDGVKENVKKSQVSQDSLEKLVKEKIPILSGNIENVTSKVKDVETKLSSVDDRLGTVDKSIGIIRTGIDGVKENVKKSQVSQDSLEKLVKEKIPVLSGNIENVTSEVKDVKTKLDIVDDRLDTVDKSIGIFCTGIDCIIVDVKKSQVSQDSLEKLVQEKITELSGNIENITSEVKDVKIKQDIEVDRLDTVDKSIGIFCTGIDGVKEDIKKFQISQDSLEKLVQEKYLTLYKDLKKSHDILAKFVQERFEELGEKVQALENQTFICENCGEQVIVPLSSYCPNCGSQIQSWSDEDGQPAKGWIPYWKRQSTTS